jgi:hypothetical protein
LIATASIGATPAYPVKVGPTGRYLVDQHGAPFLIAGESPQAMIGNLSEADAELFFANRRAHGFNTVWINLLCASYTGCRHDGSTFDDIPPFTVPNDFSTPNEAYFARADRILQLASRYGFLVLLDPAETGSWLRVMRDNGVDKCRAFGQYLGQRYATFDNIVWMHGNDYGLPHADHDEANDALVTAIALGIKDFDTRHLHTVLFNTNTNLPPVLSTDNPRWLSIVDLNAAYTYHVTHATVLAGYNYPTPLPVFLAETGYEFEGIAVLGTAPRNLRAQVYWSNLSGATGQLYGNRFTWPFRPGWKEQLDTPGAVQMAHVTALFEPRAWFDLVPDQAHSVVTAGYGTLGSSDYVTAARTPDGRLVMAYVPSARTLTVDMSQLSGTANARWYDPAAGTFMDIPGSPFDNAGTLDFTTPGVNADGPGNEDWVLVLEVLDPKLTVAKVGSGNGQVTSLPPDLDCGERCAAGFPHDTVLTLIATPDAGSLFVGWDGDPGCSAGTVTMTGDITCLARFDVAPLPRLYSFVTSFFRNVLERVPDPSKVATWVAFLRQHPDADGLRVFVREIFNDAEALNRPRTLATYVHLLYRTILEREPADAEVAAWVDGGLLPAMNALIPGFVRSPECQNLFRTMPPSLIISRLYRDLLARAESVEENAAWADYLARGGTWEGLATGFLNSPEYTSGTRSLADHVAILYRTFLGRESEPAGLSRWLGVLTDQLGTIQLAFILSPEFRGKIQSLFR